MSTHGIHHVTGIAGNPQSNVDFYVGVLGLRLVKRTVNFDDPTRYHLYYGDGLGSPGTVVTFFAWDTRNIKGRPGTGQVTTTSFAVPVQSLDAWSRRLEAKGSPRTGRRRAWAGRSSYASWIPMASRWSWWRHPAIPARVGRVASSRPPRPSVGFTASLCR